MNRGQLLNALDALGLDDSAPSVGRVRAARRLDEWRMNNRQLEPIIRGRFTCACGRPAMYRIVHPSKDITQSAPCQEHLEKVLADYFVNESAGIAPRIQGVIQPGE